MRMVKRLDCIIAKTPGTQFLQLLFKHFYLFKEKVCWSVFTVIYCTTVGHKVTGFGAQPRAPNPNLFNVSWVKVSKRNEDSSVIRENSCKGTSVANEDGMFYAISKLKFQPAVQDNRNIYRYIMYHKSLLDNLLLSTTLTVTGNQSFNIFSPSYQNVAGSTPLQLHLISRNLNHVNLMLSSWCRDIWCPLGDKRRESWPRSATHRWGWLADLPVRSRWRSTQKPVPWEGVEIWCQHWHLLISELFGMYQKLFRGLAWNEIHCHLRFETQTIFIWSVSEKPKKKRERQSPSKLEWLGHTSFCGMWPVI